ncbi:MAG: SgcJ/EcaC family oxidoreductase [bacterium]
MIVAAAAPMLALAQSPTPEAAIREHTAAYAAAMNKHDATAVAALFAPDGDQVIGDGSRIAGRAAIRDAAQKELSTWPAARRITLAVTAVRVLTPDIAIAETSATFSEGPVKTNRGTSVMVRQNGKWQIAALRVYPAAAM